MIEQKLNYHPKGGMCAVCFRLHMDCSHLPFEEMPKISKGDKDGTVIVKCTLYMNRDEAVQYERNAT